MWGLGGGGEEKAKLYYVWHVCKSAKCQKCKFVSRILSMIVGRIVKITSSPCSRLVRRIKPRGKKMAAKNVWERRPVFPRGLFTVLLNEQGERGATRSLVLQFLGTFLNYEL